MSPRRCAGIRARVRATRFSTDGPQVADRVERQDDPDLERDCRGRGAAAGRQDPPPVPGDLLRPTAVRSLPQAAPTRWILPANGSLAGGVGCRRRRTAAGAKTSEHRSTRMRRSRRTGSGSWLRTSQLQIGPRQARSRRSPATMGLGSRGVARPKTDLGGRSMAVWDAGSRTRESPKPTRTMSFAALSPDGHLVDNSTRRSDRHLEREDSAIDRTGQGKIESAPTRRKGGRRHRFPGRHDPRVGRHDLEGEGLEGRKRCDSGP